MVLNIPTSYMYLISGKVRQCIQYRDIACSGPYPALKKVRGEGHHFVIYMKEVQVYNNEWVWFTYNKDIQ